MSKHIFHILLPLSLWACGSPEQPTATVTTDPLGKYRPLIGVWVDSTTSPHYTSYERWSAEGDTAIQGFGHVIANGDTVFIEDLRLSMVNDRVVYSARVGSQNNGTWVPFTADVSGVDTLMFENAEHDFPQCITYIRDHSGTWNVRVTGTEQGNDRSEEYHFRPR
ncbi:MAG: hypothetical protein IPI81_02545 [Flavobacteriales bacterium]|nr:hypothetical protein [Flavobacteriales bacterium]MCC6936950.1 hypothetical protein [Flavobacteriales bacterium]